MVYILLGDGFEETEAIAPIDILRRAKVEIELLSLYADRLEVTSSHKVKLICDKSIYDIDLSSLEMVILPGGLGGVNELKANKKVREILEYARDNSKYIAAICAAPTILSEYGLLADREATCYPDMKKLLDCKKLSKKKVAISDNIITSEAAGSAIEFGLALAEIMSSRKTAVEVKNAIHF